MRSCPQHLCGQLSVAVPEVLARARHHRFLHELAFAPRMDLGDGPTQQCGEYFTGEVALVGVLEFPVRVIQPLVQVWSVRPLVRQAFVPAHARVSVHTWPQVRLLLP